jgi:hypothetical protein
MATPLDGWCECGYRRSAHLAGNVCPAWAGSSYARTFKSCPGHDLAESLHVRPADEQGSLL